MERCVNCKWYYVRDICAFCAANGSYKEIKHPFFMGGSKKCECYERYHPDKKKKFEYPKKGDKVN